MKKKLEDWQRDKPLPREELSERSKRIIEKRKNSTRKPPKPKENFIDYFINRKITEVDEISLFDLESDDTI
jgi:hypothetical protein